MTIRQELFVILILTTSIGVLAQITGTEPPAVASSGAKASDQAEILTDTMGIDFGPYVEVIRPIVKRNWYSMIPPSAYPPIKKQGKVSIEFSVLKDGTVSGMTLHTSSGDVLLDRAAWASIAASSPLPPLPKEFPGQILGLRFYFFYSLQPPGSSTNHLCHFGSNATRISPCGDVRVPAGSTLKFGALGKDTYSGGLFSAHGVAIDGSGNVWVADDGLYGKGYGISEFSSTGTPITGTNGYTGGKISDPSAVAVDGSGNVWIADGNGNDAGGEESAVTELIGAATPVITPIAAGLPSTPSSNGTSSLGTRP